MTISQQSFHNTIVACVTEGSTSVSGSVVRVSGSGSVFAEGGSNVFIIDETFTGSLDVTGGANTVIVSDANKDLLLLLSAKPAFEASGKNTLKKVSPEDLIKALELYERGSASFSLIPQENIAQKIGAVDELQQEIFNVVNQQAV